MLLSAAQAKDILAPTRSSQAGVSVAKAVAGQLYKAVGVPAIVRTAISSNRSAIDAAITSAATDFNEQFAYGYNRSQHSARTWLSVSVTVSYGPGRVVAPRRYGADIDQEWQAELYGTGYAS
jgi:hypothetical protein